ncbi:MAG: ShlB/FhaC/HecB family hemolysin secretion/activation protein [Selenomonas sp.]|nr:ShlB/FhaC/HecB family hemolysin secretion/activation protein [Selenomonas sp.]
MTGNGSNKKSWLINTPLAKVAAAAVLSILVNGNAAQAAPAMSDAHQNLPEKLTEPAKATLEAKTPASLPVNTEVKFDIANFRLEAPELYLDKMALTKILQDGMGKEKTLSQLNHTLDALTSFCRQNGYPAAAAYVPAQESTDGMILIKVIPGRYGKIKLANSGQMTENAVHKFTAGLKEDSIIKTNALETVLYNLSDINGNRAVGVLSPGEKFGTSDLMIRLEKGKPSSTILYAENYGSQSSGRYRYGFQENIYNASGNGDKVSVGGIISNSHMHNYYVNYETLVGHGGTMLGVGYSQMDYNIAPRNMGIKPDGNAKTVSLFGKYPLYHYADRSLTFKYGYDYRALEDNLSQNSSSISSKKHSHSVHAGLDGFNRAADVSVEYGVNILTGELGIDSEYANSLIQNGHVASHYTKAEANAAVTQRLGHSADALIKISGQKASNNLDSSEEFYLGGANGVRAYPQGELSGDEGILGTIETRFYTKSGLIPSIYFDAGNVRYNKDGMKEGSKSYGILKGWGVGLAYNQAGDWFMRLDYARRIGQDPNMSEAAKAKGRTWFMLGKIW